MGSYEAGWPVADDVFVHHNRVLLEDSNACAATKGKVPELIPLHIRLPCLCCEQYAAHLSCMHPHVSGVADGHECLIQLLHIGHYWHHACVLQNRMYDRLQSAVWDSWQALGIHWQSVEKIHDTTVTVPQQQQCSNRSIAAMTTTTAKQWWFRKLWKRAVGMGCTVL